MFHTNFLLPSQRTSTYLYYILLTRAKHCLWIVGNGTTLFNNLTVDLMDQIMDFPVDPIMAAKAYKYKAEILLKEYLLADSYVLYTSVLAGLLMCNQDQDWDQWVR
ncbi:uncharacterized protein [Zea mays]|uniref:uncharacterized protein isoform X2 n=1 Tax=Zea mays TaxID=4577 RepID=UPI0004DE8A2A|nr:uncharacterized protein LOC103643983 isoform X2 [Zea mays]|eukprot:XP_008665381.1 uncharacterized protein LOC103643983 isoform X2 [Zea mays]